MGDRLRTGAVPLSTPGAHVRMGQVLEAAGYQPASRAPGTKEGERDESPDTVPQMPIRLAVSAVSPGRSDVLRGGCRVGRVPEAPRLAGQDSD